MGMNKDEAMALRAAGAKNVSYTEPVAHKDRAHSPIGGSVAKRIIECPGSVALCAKYPSVESSFAAEGTACHEAIDLVLSNKTKQDRDVIGLTLNGIVITEELFEDGIGPALEQFDKLDKELGGIEYLNEQRVVFPGIENAFGTVDIIGRAKDRVVVLDWKFGRGVAVSAVKNAQMLYYAVAAMNTPSTSKWFADDLPIEFFIVQPMVNDGEPFTRWMTSKLQLEAFALEFRKAVLLSEQPDAPLKLGGWCKFCTGKIECPLYNGMARDALALTPEQRRLKLEEVLPFADMFIELGEAIKAMAHQHLEEGGQLADWKLVPKRPHRLWTDEDKALKFLAKSGVPADQRHVKKFLSPKQAEDALKRNNLPAVLPPALVTSHSSGTTLAPASDPRPAVALQIEVLKRLADRLSAN